MTSVWFPHCASLTPTIHNSLISCHYPWLKFDMDAVPWWTQWVLSCSVMGLTARYNVYLINNGLKKEALQQHCA